MTRDKRKADRIKAIILLGKGWSNADVAEALLVDSKTVAPWHERYTEKGVDGLLDDNHCGGLAYLTAEQLQKTSTSSSPSPSRKNLSVMGINYAKYK